MHSLIVDTCGTPRSVLVEASDVEPLVQRDHVSGGTTYLVGLCVQRDLVSGGEGPYIQTDHVPCMGACI